MNIKSLTLTPGSRPRRPSAGRWVGPALLAALLAACSSSPVRAPIEERAPSRGARGTAAAEAPKPPPPGIENAGKPGYFTVRPGDTLIRIGLDTGQNWRDLARWNNLDNPNLIEVGQVLRVVPPGVDPSATVVRGVSAGRAETRPLDAKPPAAAPSVVAVPSTSSSAGPSSTAAASAPAAAASAPHDADEDLNWAWPSSDPVVGSFEEGRTRGIVLVGSAGDPVLAAADGRVIYAGAALRGYGNLIIVKHNATYLTAYAHNQALLVKENQVVRRGQRIAEMGATDADRVQLHFEVRRLGKPIDPLKVLPAR